MFGIAIGWPLQAQPASPDRSGPRCYPGLETPSSVGGEVTLDELMAYADEHAPRLAVVRAGLLGAQAEMAGARPSLPENLELSGAVGARTTGDDAFPEFELGLEQSFEIGGQRARRIELANANRERFEAEVQEVCWELHGELHGAYTQALLARRHLGLATQFRDFAQELMNIAEARVDAGDEPAVHLIVARAELAMASQQIIVAERDYAQASTELAAVVGWPIGSPPVPSELDLDVRPPPPLESLLDRAADDHPGYEAHRRAVRAAEARIRLEDSEATPDPWVGVGWAREGEPDGSVDVWTLSFGIPIPSWQRNQGGQADALADREVAVAESTQFALENASRITHAHAGVESAVRRVEALGADVLPNLEANFQLARRAYELGDVSLMDVSQTRERILRVQEEGLFALADYYDALATLEAALGDEVWPESTGGP